MEVLMVAKHLWILLEAEIENNWNTPSRLMIHRFMSVIEGHINTNDTLDSAHLTEALCNNVIKKFEDQQAKSDDRNRLVAHTLIGITSDYLRVDILEQVHLNSYLDLNNDQVGFITFYFEDGINLSHYLLYLIKDIGLNKNKKENLIIAKKNLEDLMLGYAQACLYDHLQPYAKELPSDMKQEVDQASTIKTRYVHSQLRGKPGGEKLIGKNESDHVIVGRISARFPVNFFQFQQKYHYGKELQNDLYIHLTKEKFLEGRLNDFVKVFRFADHPENELIKANFMPLKWLVKKGCLAYLIHALYSENKLFEKTDQWKVVAECFLVQSESITNDAISRVKPTTNNGFKKKVNDKLKELKLKPGKNTIRSPR